MKQNRHHEKKLVIKRISLITKKIKTGDRKKTVIGHIPVIIFCQEDLQGFKKNVIAIYYLEINIKKKIMKYKNYRSFHFASERIKWGLSQQQLANKLAVSKSAIGMFETGRRKLPPGALIKLVELQQKMDNTTNESSSTGCDRADLPDEKRKDE